MAVSLMICFFVGLAIGLPVSFVMGISAFISFIVDGSLPLAVLPQQFFAGINSFPIMAIPFFMLASDLMSGGKLTDALIDYSNNIVGHIRGGLGHVNVLVSVFFAGISGSALADAAGPSAVVMKMMREAGYDAYYAGAITAASAVIGPIIPPSIIAVMYALSDNRTTVTGLFIAGVIPGLLLAAGLMILNHIISSRRNYRFHHNKPTLRVLLKSFVNAVPALLLPVIILGGIFGGIFTATEAAAVAVAYSLIVGLIRKSLNFDSLKQIFLRSALITSAVMLLVSMGSAFSWSLAFAQVPQKAAALISGITTDATMLMVLIAIVATIAGMFVDTLPAVIILTPVIAPIAAKAGLNPLHTGMVVVLSIAVGMLTPPVAPLLFVVSTVGRIKYEKLVASVLPFILVEFAVIGLVVLFPVFSTWLPRLLGLAN
ncbi:MAG TPA: TRAP transporter large permease [Bacillota bacterium]|nr:TRAP transporter large permease [Bacillota bacterium]HOA15286.1 TRAP transporter large permease [Bacillota bacterium]